MQLCHSIQIGVRTLFVHVHTIADRKICQLLGIPWQSHVLPEKNVKDTQVYQKLQLQGK